MYELLLKSGKESAKFLALIYPKEKIHLVRSIVYNFVGSELPKEIKSPFNSLVYSNKLIEYYKKLYQEIEIKGLCGFISKKIFNEIRSMINIIPIEHGRIIGNHHAVSADLSHGVMLLGKIQKTDKKLKISIYSNLVRTKICCGSGKND